MYINVHNFNKNDKKNHPVDKKTLVHILSINYPQGFRVIYFSEIEDFIIIYLTLSPYPQNLLLLLNI